VLDLEGKRVAVKYYGDEWPSAASKLAFEKSVFVKTQKPGAKAEEGELPFKRWGKCAFHYIYIYAL
jgi:hypothetical protein